MRGRPDADECRTWSYPGRGLPRARLVRTGVGDRGRFRPRQPVRHHSADSHEHDPNGDAPDHRPRDVRSPLKLGERLEGGAEPGGSRISHRRAV